VRKMKIEGKNKREKEGERGEERGEKERKNE